MEKAPITALNKRSRFAGEGCGEEGGHEGAEFGDHSDSEVRDLSRMNSIRPNCLIRWRASSFVIAPSFAAIAMS